MSNQPYQQKTIKHIDFTAKLVLFKRAAAWEYRYGMFLDKTRIVILKILKFCQSVTKVAYYLKLQHN